LIDLRMMFGCRAASNWAQRGTGMVTWLLQQAMDGMSCGSDEVRQRRAAGRGAGVPEADLRVAYASCFIDDQTWLSVLSAARPMTAIAAALWKTIGLTPQGKKVWFEGSFATT